MLINGRDPGHIDFRWYTGYDLDGQYFPSATQRTGLAALEIVDEVDLIAVPDLAGQTLLPAPTGPTGPDALYLVPHRQVLHHATRLGDRLALLDTRAGVPQTAAAQLPQQLADPLAARFGAVYYPWLNVAGGPAPRAMPPSGFVAGVIARADFEGGVTRAPANFPVRDVVNLELLLTTADQDTLNPAGVNVFRRFEAPALELWGARTLSSDPAGRYVNVRRLLIAIKKAIARRLLWTVFEPNGPLLRRRLLANLQSLMTTLVTGGAMPVATDAFFVKCDAENNPPELAEAGQLVATIGVALVAPAEFIVINVKRTPDALSVSEVGA
jgi:phage tail sheath protein FI